MVSSALVALIVLIAFEVTVLVTGVEMIDYTATQYIRDAHGNDPTLCVRSFIWTLVPRNNKLFRKDRVEVIKTYV